MLVAAFFPNISQFSVDSPLSKAYPPFKHGCPLPSTCWMVGLQASTLFPEEVWLLRQHHLLVVTSPRPRPNNLLAFTNICLSLSSLASSGVAHGPKSLFEPFILTIIMEALGALQYTESKIANFFWTKFSYKIGYNLKLQP